jgi:hypothetical protein
MLGCSKKLKNIFKLTNNKKQPIKPKMSSIENSYQEENNDFHENFAPNAILKISAILKYFDKQKQMVYIGCLDNISAFEDCRNFEDLPNYRRFCESQFFQQKSIYLICAAILN